MSDKASAKSFKKKIRPFASIADHWLIFLLFLLMSGAGAGAAYFLIPPSYTSTAFIEIHPREYSNMGQDRTQPATSYKAFVKNQELNIMSSEVLHSAVKSLEESSDMTEEQKEAMIKNLGQDLVVKWIPNTFRIAVSLSSKEKKGLADTVNAIVASYIKKMDEDKFRFSDTIVDNLKKRASQLKSELQGFYTHKSTIVAKLGHVSFDELQNPYDETMLTVSVSLNEARQKRIEAEARCENIDSIVENTFSSDIDVVVDQKLEEDPFLINLYDALSKEKIRLVSSIVGTGKEHPGRKAIEKELEEIEKEFEAIREGKKQEIKVRLEKERKDKLDRERQRILDAVKITRAHEDALQKQFDDHKEAINKKAFLYQEALNVIDSIKQNRELYLDIQKRLDYFRTEENAPGFVVPASKALEPDQPDQGKKLKIIAIILLGGFVISIGIPILLDLMDPWIKTPGEIENTLHYPLLGWVLEQDRAQARNFAEDQLRRIAIALNRQRLENGTKFVVMTSVKPGGGTTKLTLDIASELNRIGVRCLAVEMNAFMSHPEFGTETSHQQRGVYSLMRQQCSIDEVIIPGNEELPDRIPVGDTQGNRHLIFNDRFTEILSQSNYDMFLLDTPPLLLSADTEYLARNSDATILIVEAEAVQAGEIGRAGAHLKKISPPRVAFIANRVHVKKSRGYFNKMLKEFETGQKT